MSLYLVPTSSSFNHQQRRRPQSCFGSGNASSIRAWPADMFQFGKDATVHAPMPFAFDQSVVMMDQDDLFEARLRKQQQLDEQRLRQHYYNVRRQAEIERERERELQRRRIREEHERRLRLQQEAEARAAAAAAAIASALRQREEEEQRKQRAAAAQAAFVQRKRREWEALQRQRFLAAKQQHQQEQEQWEQLAAHGLAGALNFATKLFGAFVDNDNNDEKMHVDKPIEKHDNNVQAADVNIDDDQDPADVYPELTLQYKQQPIQQETDTATYKAAVENESSKVDDNVAAVDATELEPEQQKPSTEKLIFSYPLPTDVLKRAAIKADDIHVSFDQATGSIQIRGLWNNDTETQGTPRPSSTISDSGSDDDDKTSVVSGTSSRKRGRSPVKRSRVSDVDETTGEEIVVPEQEESLNEQDDGFVKVSSSSSDGKRAEGTARVPLTDGAQIANLRAELSDDGFHLYV